MFIVDNSPFLVVHDDLGQLFENLAPSLFFMPFVTQEMELCIYYFLYDNASCHENLALGCSHHRRCGIDTQNNHRIIPFFEGENQDRSHAMFISIIIKVT